MRCPPASCVPCSPPSFWVYPSERAPSGRSLGRAAGSSFLSARQPPSRNDEIVAGAHIGVEEHEPAMEARAVLAARLDVLADRQPEDGVAEAMIGRKGQARDPAQQ